MTWMQKRRTAMMPGKTAAENLIVSFTEQTKSFSNFTNIEIPLTETIVKGMKYRVVLDGTVPSGARFLVLLGAQNNTITYYPDGQDGEEARIWTTAQSGNTTVAKAYIYCRPVSGTATITATVRNIKIYREGW